MDSGGERWMVVLVHTSPLLGIPVWVFEMSRPGNSWNFALMFASGLFMIAAGLAVSGAVWFLGRGFVKTEAVSSLRFQAILSGFVCLFVVGFGIALLFDPANPTMHNQPVATQGVLMVAAFFLTFVVPIVELIRSIVMAARVWRGSREILTRSSVSPLS